MLNQSSSNTHPSGPASLAPLIALASSMAIASLGTSIANVSLPTLCKSFGSPYEAVQWTVLAYLLSMTCCSVIVGRMGDMIGRTKLLHAGLLLFTTASIIGSLAPNLSILIGARAFQGLGASIMMVQAIALVTLAAPAQGTGRIMGFLASMSAVGTALGPPAGGILISIHGWQTVYWALGILGLFTFIVAKTSLPAEMVKQPSTPKRFDSGGSILLILLLGTYSMIMARSVHSSSSLTQMLAVACILSAIGFVVMESRHPNPLVQLHLLRLRTRAASLLINALVSAVMMATLVVGPFYLTNAHHLDTRKVGLAMAIGPALTAILGAPVGILVDRFGSPRLIVLALAGMLLGCASLAHLPSSWGLPGYLTSIAWLTSHYALFQSAIQTSVMQEAPADKKGLISGLLSLSRNLGLITGAAVLGNIFSSTTTGPIHANLDASSILGMHKAFEGSLWLLGIAISVGVIGFMPQGMRSLLGLKPLFKTQMDV